MKMFYNICCSTAGVNYVLSDISGLAAQVEVRSPFLDHRVVEFAAKLPHKYKIRNVFSSNFNKYLPKLYYERHVPKDFAWSRKKGLAYNIKFSDYMRMKSDSDRLLSASVDAVDRAGLDSKYRRTIYNKYIASIAKKVKISPADSRVMMSTFMLGRWLMLNAGLTAKDSR